MSIAVPPYIISGGEPCALRPVPEYWAQPYKDVFEDEPVVIIESDYGGILRITSCINSDGEISVPMITLPPINSGGTMNNILGGATRTGSIESGSFSGTFDRSMFCIGADNQWGCGSEGDSTQWSIVSTSSGKRISFSSMFSRNYRSYLFEIPFASGINIWWDWNTTIQNTGFMYVYKYIPISQEN